MKIKYSSNKLEKQLTVPKDLSKRFGTMAKKVAQRISELKAAKRSKICVRFQQRIATN